MVVVDALMGVADDEQVVRPRLLPLVGGDATERGADLGLRRRLRGRMVCLFDLRVGQLLDRLFAGT